MILESDILPLRTDETGTIRVAGTRITLDVLLGFYNQGHTVEELQEGFPSLSLGDIHSVIGYYLRHRESLDEYLRIRQKAADKLRDEIESRYPPEVKAKLEEFKSRRSTHRPEP